MAAMVPARLRAMTGVAAERPSRVCCLAQARAAFFESLMVREI
jgi:hypothetical protein